jgi:hypothetical protein
VARFWFVRPGDNNVSVGPYKVASRRLPLRGACISGGGAMTWKVFDNSTPANEASGVKIVSQGVILCDGEVHQGAPDLGRHKEIGVLAVTGTPKGDDSGESAWVIIANE